jgi:hypothetical protein
MHFGPLYVTPAFLVKYLGVDTNVFNRLEDPKTDFTFTAGPEVELLLPYRRLRFTASGGVDYVYFRTYANQRGFNTSGTLRAEALLTRLTLFSALSLADTKGRLNLEVDARRRRIENALELGVVVKATPKVDVEVSVRQSNFDYRPVGSEGPTVGLDDDPIRELLNRDGRAARLRAMYRWTPLTTIMFGADVEEVRYPLAASRNKDIVRIGPSVEFKPRALISGQAEVGVRTATTFSDEIPDSTRVYTRVGLSYTLPGSMQLGVTGSRDVVDSTDPLEPFFIVNSFGLSLRRPIAGRYDVIGTGSYTRHEYESALDEQGLPVVASGRSLIGRSYSVNVGYTLRRSTRIGVGVWYDTRRSNREDLREFDGLRAGTTVTYGF